MLVIVYPMFVRLKIGWWNQTFTNMKWQFNNSYIFKCLGESYNKQKTNKPAFRNICLLQTYNSKMVPDENQCSNVLFML